MKLLVDMNLSPRGVTFLVDAGFETSHWSTLGATDASDSEIMRFAADGSYVVLTHDLDFSAILAVTRGVKPSVIQIRSEIPSPELIVKPVVAAIRQLSAELAAGALVVIEPQRTRVRILPLR